MTSAEYEKLNEEELKSGVVKKVEDGIYWDNRTQGAVFTQG